MRNNHRRPMQVGVDSSKFPGAGEHGPEWVIRRAAELGLEGVFFRSVFELSASLDHARLRDLGQMARDLDMSLAAGVGKVNPFSAPETPEIRDLGEGDYLAGIARMVAAASHAGIAELWTATANYHFQTPGLRACDRFRTDTSWDDQLRGTAKVLHRLAPMLRDYGAHLNLETHEEITSFEVVRLVEEVGPDVLGITFDTANVLVRCEDPVAAARRVAPYVRATHIRDVALHFTDSGIGRFLRPVGSGCLDWPTLLKPLLDSGAMLSIEGISRSRAEMTLYIDDPEWHDSHPDLTMAEAFNVIRLTRSCEAMATAGGAPSLAELRGPLAVNESLEFITSSAENLRTIMDSLIDETNPSTDRISSYTM